MMEVPTEVQINVLNNFQVLIPLSGDSDSFVFTQTTNPTLGLTLTRTDTNDSYHYQIQMLQSKGVTEEFISKGQMVQLNGSSEEIVSSGLVWAKRAPYQFQKQPNTSIVEALVCRLRIPTGIFDFRRVKQRSIRFVVRCFSNNVLLSTGVSQICKILPKKRLATEGEADENNNLVIPICWVLDSNSDQSESAACLFQTEQYSSPEDYQEDGDSVMDNLNSSDGFAGYGNEGDSDDLSRLTVSHTNYILTEPDPIVANDPLSQYMVLYNGNAEVIGNFRALNFYKASDIRIKEDVQLLSDDHDPRSVLLKIDGVEYKFKQGTVHHASVNKRFVGYIAQQIESVVPEAVQLIDGILHVDYESLIPYLSESIKQNFKDINDIKSDTSQIHQVIDMMYTEFVKKEQKSEKSSLVFSAQQTCSRSLQWIIGASVAVLLLISVVIGVFVVMPLVHPAVVNNFPEVPNAPTSDAPIPTQSSTPISTFPSIDQDVLVELYHATGGSDSWTPKASPSISGCEWPGVTCDTNFRVVGLELEAFVGTIPDSIGRLDEIRTLQLHSQYKVFGTIPASIGNFTKLVKLDLQLPKFTGSVPMEIFSLTSLETLVLNNNWILSWTIPPQLANLKELRFFEASWSGLHGTIPDGISGLTKLQLLALGSNNLTGTVPSLASTSVHQLRLENNHFTGPIPKLNEQLFSQNEKLELSVRIANNNFSGEFDLPIVQKNMNYYDFGNNSLTSVASRFDKVTTRNVFCFAAGNPFKCPIPEWFQILCKATCT